MSILSLRRLELVTGADVAPGTKGIVLNPHGGLPGTAKVTFAGVSLDAEPGVDFQRWVPSEAAAAAESLAPRKCPHRRLAAECGECPRAELRLRSAVRVADDASQTWFEGTVAAQKEDGSVVVRVDGFGCAAWDRVVLLDKPIQPKYQYTPTVPQPPPPAPAGEDPAVPCGPHRRPRGECGGCPRSDVAVGDTVEVCDDGTSTWFSGKVERLGDYGEPIVAVPGFRRQPWDRLRRPGAAAPPAAPKAALPAGDRVRVAAGGTVFDGVVTSGGGVHVPGVGTGVHWDQVWRDERAPVENSYDRFWRLRAEEEEREKQKIEESAEERRRRELDELEQRRLKAELALACDAVETQEARDRVEEEAEEGAERTMLLSYARIGAAERREMLCRRDVSHDEEWERRVADQARADDLVSATRREQRRLDEERRQRERGDEWARLEEERLRLEQETRRQRAEREAALAAAEQERQTLRAHNLAQRRAEEQRMRDEQERAVADRRAALADDWQELRDATGRVYYHSPSLGETRWVHPKGAPAPPSPTPADGDDWAAYTDAEGRTYYHSSSRGETRWDDPREAATAAAPAAAEVTPTAAEVTPAGAEAKRTSPGSDTESDSDAAPPPARAPAAPPQKGLGALFADDTESDAPAPARRLPSAAPAAARQPKAHLGALFADDTESDAPAPAHRAPAPAPAPRPPPVGDSSSSESERSVPAPRPAAAAAGRDELAADSDSSADGAAQSGAATRTPFVVGDAVEVTGLTKDASLNGHVGTVAELRALSSGEPGAVVTLAPSEGLGGRLLRVENLATPAPREGRWVVVQGLKNDVSLNGARGQVVSLAPMANGAAGAVVRLLPPHAADKKLPFTCLSVTPPWDEDEEGEEDDGAGDAPPKPAAPPAKPAAGLSTFFDGSSSGSDAPPAPASKAAPPAAPADSASSDDMFAPQPAKPPAKKAAAKPAAKKGASAFADSSSSESDAPPKKPAPKKPAAKKPAAKRGPSAFADSSGSDSDAPSQPPAARKAAAKKAGPPPRRGSSSSSSDAAPTQAAKPSAKSAKPGAKGSKPAAKKSGGALFADSSSSSSSEGVVKAKPAPKKVAAPQQGRKPPTSAARGGFWDDDSSDSD